MRKAASRLGLQVYRKSRWAKSGQCIKINRQRKSASGGFCTIPLFPYHSGCHADDKKIM